MIMKLNPHQRSRRNSGRPQLFGVGICYDEADLLMAGNKTDWLTGYVV
jgi:hypothetical protein